MKKYFIILCLMVLFFSGCADNEAITECLVNKPYGFFGGLWHGIIFTFSLIGSFFSDDIVVYAVNNNGAWYDIGYYIGLGSSIGGVTKVSKS